MMTKTITENGAKKLATILVAVSGPLAKESPLHHPPSKLLLRSLATSDLCVGIIGEPLLVVYWLSVTKRSGKFCRFTKSALFLAAHTLCSVFLFTITTIAVERPLALQLGLRYGHVVTLKRAYVLLNIYWAVSIVGSTINFVDYLITLLFGYIVTPLCLPISLISYGKKFSYFAL